MIRILLWAILPAPVRDRMVRTWVAASRAFDERLAEV